MSILRTILLTSAVLTYFHVSPLAMDEPMPGVGAQAASPQTSKYFKQRYLFSPHLLDHKSIEDAFRKKTISAQDFLNAFLQDALDNKVPESFDKVYDLFTSKPEKSDF